MEDLVDRARWAAGVYAAWINGSAVDENALDRACEITFDLLQALAEDLRAEVEERYPEDHRNAWPVVKRRYERDIALVEATEFLLEHTHGKDCTEKANTQGEGHG